MRAVRSPHHLGRTQPAKGVLPFGWAPFVCGLYTDLLEPSVSEAAQASSSSKPMSLRPESTWHSLNERDQCAVLEAFDIDLKEVDTVDAGRGDNALQGRYRDLYVCAVEVRREAGRTAIFRTRRVAVPARAPTAVGNIATFVKPLAQTLNRRFSNISGIGSTASTRPSGPTRFAAKMVKMPELAPKSTKTSPGWRDGNTCMRPTAFACAPRTRRALSVLL